MGLLALFLYEAEQKILSLIPAALAQSNFPAPGSSGSTGGGSTVVQLTNPLGASCNNLTCPLTTVTNFLFTIAIPICGIIILVGGFQMMTAGGNPEKFSKGKKTLLYAVIGFVVVLLAGSVATLIRNTLGGS